LRRAGAGTALVDPIPLRSDLSALVPALTGPEWVLHAANQDLPCLAEVGLAPAQLFDTELAGRLLGLPRVGLGPMVEQLLGLALEKGHGAADWSRRPLPEDWLVYAALDVEVLITLRDVLAGLLDEQGKLEWARQEFEAVRTAPPPAPRAEPWRRTSGVHRVRRPRALAAVRSLWEARDRLAAERDIAPGRVLPDAAIVDAAELPRAAPPSDGPPPVTRWADRDPAAAARLAAARAAVATVSEERSVPVENLLQPDLLRRLCWSPPPDGDVAAALRKGGAREWQIELLAPLLEPALHP